MVSVAGFESQIMIILLTIGFIVLAVAVIALAVKSGRNKPKE